MTTRKVVTGLNYHNELVTITAPVSESHVQTPKGHLEFHIEYAESEDGYRIYFTGWDQECFERNLASSVLIPRSTLVSLAAKEKVIKKAQPKWRKGANMKGTKDNAVCLSLTPYVVQR